MTGIRIAASLAVIAALVAEYFGGPADGIGTAIATYAKSGRAALAWAYVVGGILIGLVFFLVTPAFAVSGEQLRRSLGLASAAGAAPRDLRRAVLAASRCSSALRSPCG